MIQDPKLKELLMEFRTGLQAIYGSRLKGLYLFGSYARGEQKAESDVDMLVVLENFGSYYEEVRRTGQIGSDLSLKYSVTITQVFVKEADWLQAETSFLNNVRDEAIAA
ncbi:MAG: nucleotidyltransferase domain-containing protein [Candidatus Omnitrophica bacterium]|nr:nucleotidyltransferase domain-containing protein [Candidatus Omnitrophota bacterium]